MNTKCFICLDHEVNKRKKETIPIPNCSPFVAKQLQKRILAEEQMRMMIYQVLDTMFSPAYELTQKQRENETKEKELYDELHNVLQKIAEHYDEIYHTITWKH
jgi:phosphoglycolate phosphatase-like HAD superfamily hydrolase